MRYVAVWLAVFSTILHGCDRSAPTPPASTAIEDVVRTTSAPVDRMTRRIAGDLVRVEMLCPPGQDPTTWRPEPEVVSKYQRARLVIANGAEFETWVLVAPLPGSRVVLTADAITDELLVIPGETHSHGPGGSHTHDVINGYTWLDPIHASAQAGAIAEALTTAFPEHAAQFAESHANLVSELQTSHERLESADLSGVTVVASQRPFGYLARRYGWIAADIDSDPATWAASFDATSEATIDDESPPRILLRPVMPDTETTQSLWDAHRIRIVRWDTGDLASDRSYAEILTDNIDRLLSAVTEISP